MPTTSEWPSGALPVALAAPLAPRSERAPARTSNTLVPPPPEAGTVPDWCFASLVQPLRPPPTDLVEDFARRVARAARLAAQATTAPHAARRVRRTHTRPAPPSPRARRLAALTRVAHVALLLAAALAAAFCAVRTHAHERTRAALARPR